MNGNNGMILAAALLAVGILGGAGQVRSAPSETLRPLLRETMPNMPGHTLTAVEVVFPLSAKSSPHRHGSAFLFASVLAGTVRSQIEGEPVRVYRTGDSWTERPGDHHVLTENGSSTESATLLVVFIAPTGDALKADDP
ncbi:cupin domain-containing protein [Alsobacter sp. KACC 23698]|uniref:Cupin domain-containing protein n=1 Tax=Alsobacter sp. KACC 23698 TaxID=3149229 RepID=A0AAU7JK76_9HYPH